jgi:2-iminobutanoate/2-iminopropanoate deaminase
MKKTVISTGKAPAAIGPYAQANRVGDLVFTSGQIPLDPGTGEIVGETAAEQADQVLRNLKAVVEASGSDLDHVVKTLVFLTNMDDFASVNEVYARYFAGDDLPSRSAVAVAALPRGARVEIEAVALVI